MIANYGYTDGSGNYFITIDTSHCTACEHHRCITACPERLFIVEPDDYDEMAASIKKEFRHHLKYKCAPCKPVTSRPPLPCISACNLGAINHSW